MRGRGPYTGRAAFQLLPGPAGFRSRNRDPDRADGKVRDRVSQIGPVPMSGRSGRSSGPPISPPPFTCDRLLCRRPIPRRYNGSILVRFYHCILATRPSTQCGLVTASSQHYEPGAFQRAVVRPISPTCGQPAPSKRFNHLLQPPGECFSDARTTFIRPFVKKAFQRAVARPIPPTRGQPGPAPSSLDAPGCSPAERDREAKAPHWTAPSRRVGDPASSQFESVRHSRRRVAIAGRRPTIGCSRRGCTGKTRLAKW